LKASASPPARRAFLAASLLALSAFVFPGGSGPGVAWAQTPAARVFQPGDGMRALGVLDAPPEAEIEGPQAIAAGDDGAIYLLDQVNARVVAFEPGKGEGLTRSLALPPNSQPTDMIVSGGQIYVWDGKPIRLDERGEGATRSLASSGADIDETTRSMFGQLGAPVVEGEPSGGLTRAVGRPREGAQPPRPSGRQMVATKGAGAVSASVEVGGDQRSASITVTSKGSNALLARMALRTRERIGTVELLDVDRDGRLFVLSESISSAGGAATFVARFSPRGQLEGVHELPLAPDVALSRRFVTVDAQGDVYFLRTRKGVVDVLPIGFAAYEKNQVIDLAPRVHAATPGAAGQPPDPRGSPISAVRPLTREQVIRTAHQFAEVAWRVTPAAYGVDPDISCSGFAGRVRRPQFMIGKPQQVVKGVPYCWGCMGSLPQIAARINSGVKAGNVCTRQDPRRDAAGVDCSAFVSAAWGLSTHFSTLAIPSITAPVGNPWDMLPGDAINKPGSHVMLFLGFTPDRKVEVIEASPGACGGKVCRNVYPMASLLARGYSARRYKGLLDAPAPWFSARPAATADRAR
jgi:hypothetical protein